MAIDGAYLAHVHGEGIERLAALLIRRRHPTAGRVNPAQGDGGIDVLLESPDGLVVQVKRFSTPLTSGQKQQGKSFLAAILGDPPCQRTPVAFYTLVTFWTPTESALKWLRDRGHRRCVGAHPMGGRRFSG